MDCRRTFAAFLIGIALLAASPTPPPLREIQWLDGAHRIEALTTEPAECVRLPTDRGQRAEVALGRQLFRTPLLLGGQAARAGLSCASCHRNGRGNTAFLFPGLSGMPGTADVTSSLMSRTRGDGLNNPVAIPDLAMSPVKVSRAPTERALEHFIRGLIVDEFDGTEPAPRSLAALTAYVRAIDATQCKAAVARTLAHDLGEVTLGIGVLRGELAGDDMRTTRLAMSGIRDRLGQIAARYPHDRASQAALVKLDRSLAKVETVRALDRWDGDWAKLAEKLANNEATSLYDISRLSAFIRVSGDPKP